MKRAGCILATVFLLASESSLLADLTVTLSPSVRCISPGKEVTFSGVLTNTSTTSKLFLNDIRATMNGTSATQVTLKSNTFFSNVPGILLPGESYEGPLFRVRLAAGAPAANYSGSLAFDGGGTIFAIDELTATSFTLLAGPVDQWRFLQFGSSADEAAAADTADWDGDGLKNLLEYALQLDPKTNSVTALPPAQVLDDHLALSYLPSASDLTYVVEASTNLTAWSSAEVEQVIVANPLPPGSVTYRYKHALSSTSGKVFLRLRVTRVP